MSSTWAAVRARRTRQAAAAAAGALVLSVGACSSDDSAGAAGDDPGSADSSASEPAADPTEDESTEAQPAGDTLDAETFIPAVTEAMLAAGSAKLQATVEAGGQEITISGVQEIGETSAQSSVQFTLSGGGLDGELVLVDEVIYLDLGPLTQNKFIKIDADDPAARQFGQLLESASAAESVAALQGAIKSVKPVRETQVGGVDVTQYRMTVDSRKALASQDLPAASLQSLPPTLTYDMYVDADQLLRKFSVELAGTSTVLTTSEWGEPVEIEAPPASQISKDDPFSSPS